MNTISNQFRPPRASRVFSGKELKAEMKRAQDTIDAAPKDSIVLIGGVRTWQSDSGEFSRITAGKNGSMSYSVRSEEGTKDFREVTVRKLRNQNALAVKVASQAMGGLAGLAAGIFSKFAGAKNVEAAGIGVATGIGVIKGMEAKLSRPEELMIDSTTHEDGFVTSELAFMSDDQILQYSAPGRRVSDPRPDTEEERAARLDWIRNLDLG